MGTSTIDEYTRVAKSIKWATAHLHRCCPTFRLASSAATIPDKKYCLIQKGGAESWIMRGRGKERMSWQKKRRNCEHMARNGNRTHREYYVALTMYVKRTYE